MNSFLDRVSSHAIANNMVPQSSEESSSQEDDGIDFGDPFDIRKTLLDIVKRRNSDFDPSGLVEAVRNYRQNAAIPVASTDEEGFDSEGELVDVFAELGDSLGTTISSFAGKRANLPILGESGKGLTQGLGPLAGNSGGETPSSNAISKSALPDGFKNLLQGGGPDLSGLADPVSGGDPLSGLVTKRQATGTFSDWPEWPAWPSPTPGVKSTAKVAGTDLLSALTGQQGDAQSTANGATSTKPGLLQSIPLLGEAQGRTMTKRREAVKAAKAGRTPLEIPKVKLILPDSQDLRELPTEIPMMMKERIGGRTVAEIAKRQLGSFNLNFNKATKAATEAALSKLGVQNGSAGQARRSEDVFTAQSAVVKRLLEQMDGVEFDTLFERLLRNSNKRPVPTTDEENKNVQSSSRVSKRQQGASASFDELLKAVASGALGGMPRFEDLPVEESGGLLSKRQNPVKNVPADLANTIVPAVLASNGPVNKLPIALI